MYCYRNLPYLVFPMADIETNIHFHKPQVKSICTNFQRKYNSLWEVPPRSQTTHLVFPMADLVESPGDHGHHVVQQLHDAPL